MKIKAMPSVIETSAFARVSVVLSVLIITFSAMINPMAVRMALIKLAWA
jgi:hypothetical protein